MKWIKAFHVDKNIIYKKKNWKKKIWKFEIFFVAQSPLFWAYLGITFVLGHQLGKKLYPHEAIQFFYLQKKFRKIMT